jgi:subtilisin family serine protease
VLTLRRGGVVPRNSTPGSGFQVVRAAYAEQIAAARDAGIVTVVAAGNDSRPIDGAQGYEVWPSQLPNTITVGSTAPVNGVPFPWAPVPPAAGFDQRPGYSNYGTDVDVWAPGGAGFVNLIQAQITAACSSFRAGCEGGRLYRSINGTSMASPHGAGVAALITSRATSAKSAARADAIVACLTGTGDPITLSGTAAPGLPAPTPIPGTYTVTRPRLNALRAATESCPGV